MDFRVRVLISMLPRNLVPASGSSQLAVGDRLIVLGDEAELEAIRPRR